MACLGDGGPTLPRAAWDALEQDLRCGHLRDCHKKGLAVENPTPSCPPSGSECVNTWYPSCLFYYHVALCLLGNEQNQNTQMMYAFSVDMTGYNFRSRKSSLQSPLSLTFTHTNV